MTGPGNVPDHEEEEDSRAYEERLAWEDEYNYRRDMVESMGAEMDGSLTESLPYSEIEEGNWEDEDDGRPWPGTGLSIG